METTPPLSAEENRVIWDKGTEAAFTGTYWDHFANGYYACRACDALLYRSDDKFRSGCGWPSFDEELPGAVKRQPDISFVFKDICDQIFRVRGSAVIINIDAVGMVVNCYNVSSKLRKNDRRYLIRSAVGAIKNNFHSFNAEIIRECVFTKYDVTSDGVIYATGFPNIICC
jgi:hypothetical protein